LNSSIGAAFTGRRIRQKTAYDENTSAFGRTREPSIEELVDLPLMSDPSPARLSMF